MKKHTTLFVIFALAAFWMLPDAVQAQRRTMARVVAPAAETKAITPAEKATALTVPDVGMRVTEAYVRMAARDAYFWGWPMANIYNRRLMFEKVKEPSLLGGLAPVGPLNKLSMLCDYMDAKERLVACPNQDVVYGAAVLALDKDAVVVQVPDFGKRFWVYQAVDIRTDGFAELGAMYDTKPGFYLLAGHDWNGKVPAGITRVFRSSSNTGMLVPRIFQNDTPEDKKAVQEILTQIDAYPLADFTGKMKINDWTKLPALETGAPGEKQKGETQWVKPESFFDELPALLADAKPLPGEEARYAQLKYLAQLAKTNKAMRAVMIDEATKVEAEMIAPLMQLGNIGMPLPGNWGSFDNCAQFGIDYFMRTAIAKADILGNKPNETKYYFLDDDAAGKRLNGANCYTVTFPKDPVPVKGFWSLSAYDEFHFFVPNELNRFSVGTKSTNLKANEDGTLTVYIQAENPGEDKESNWLPAPKGDFSLYIRAYWPKPEVLDGTWTPPAVKVAE